MSAEWSPELILNHELLDAQHLEIFRRLGEASTALDAGRATLEDAVTAFTEALLDHVAVEERLMNETLYPERVRHRSAHELFVADLSRMREQLFRAGRTEDVDAWILHRLPDWLRFHIRVNDLPFGEYLAHRRSHPSADARTRKRTGRNLS
jgi:hemerythrin